MRLALSLDESLPMIGKFLGYLAATYPQPIPMPVFVRVFVCANVQVRQAGSPALRRDVPGGVWDRRRRVFC